jgi:hypothetical protein
MSDKGATHDNHIDKPIKKRKISEIDAKINDKIKDNQVNDPLMKQNIENKKLKKKNLKNQK